MKPRTYYLRAGGHLPCNVGFCTGEKALHREWKDLTDDPVEHPWCDPNGARVWAFHNPKANRYRTYLICLRYEENLSWACIAALIAHEAVHVAQFLWEAIGEEKPGNEAEAYFVQSIVQEVLEIVGMPDRDTLTTTTTKEGE